MHEEDRGGVWRECGLQAVGLRRHHHVGKDLLQDKVGCDGSKSLQHRSKSVPSRSSSSLGEHGSVDGLAISSSQISQHKTDGRAVQWQVHKFLVGIELAGRALDGSVPLSWRAGRDNNLGHHAVSVEKSNVAEKPAGIGVAEAPRGTRLMATSSYSPSTTLLPSTLLPSSSSQVCSSTPTTAFRTWMQHGRGVLPIPRLQNFGNHCYRNAAVTALVVCHHFVSIPSEQWGCVARIVEAAKHDWQGLHSIVGPDGTAKLG